jgi:hypothetical protein
VVEHKALSSNPSTSNIKKTLRVNLRRLVFMYRIAIVSPPNKGKSRIGLLLWWQIFLLLKLLINCCLGYSGKEFINI